MNVRGAKKRVATPLALTYTLTALTGASTKEHCHHLLYNYKTTKSGEKSNDFLKARTEVAG